MGGALLFRRRLGSRCSRARARPPTRLAAGRSEARSVSASCLPPASSGGISNGLTTMPRRHTPRDEPGRYAYDGLDRVLHEKARLGIMTSLVTRPEGLLFNELKLLCDLTDGNLSRHLDVLQEAGLIEAWRGTEGGRPQALSDVGRRARPLRRLPRRARTGRARCASQGRPPLRAHARSPAGVPTCVISASCQSPIARCQGRQPARAFSDPTPRLTPNVAATASV